MSKQFYIESYTVTESSRGYDNNDKYEYYDTTYWRVGKSRTGKSSIVLSEKLSENSAKKLLSEINSFLKVKDPSVKINILNDKRKSLKQKVDDLDSQISNLKYLKSMCDN